MNSTLVFLHGYALDHRIWYSISPSDLDMPSVFIDLDGYGKSTHKAFTSLKDQAQSLIDQLQEKGLSNLIIIGHSMGGYLALEMLKLDDRFIQGIILLNSHPFADSPEKKDHRNRMIDHLQKHDASAYKKFFAQSLFSSDFRQIQFDMFKRVLEIIDDQPVDSMIRSLKAMRDRESYAELLTNGATPIMIIHGEKDEIIPSQLIDQAASLPQVSFCHYVDSGSHMGMIENPELIVHYIRSFCKYCHEK